MLLLVFDLSFIKRYLRLTVTILFLFFGIFYCYSALISKKFPGPFKQFNEFRNLPKGTLIGDYWDAYKINGVATDNLQSLSFEKSYVRNWDWKDIPLAEKNFYFINNNPQKGNLNDTIRQFTILFKYSGTKYNCNGIDVWLYHKVIKSYILRSVYSNKYWSLNPESKKLYANEPDSNKAELFEIIKLDKGKVALKASNGKFVAADQNHNSFLFANSDNTWDWESFNLIYTEGTKLIIKSSTGKFVCADIGYGGALIANRDVAKDWECFEMVQKH
jgi:hypothetical protein